MFRKFHVKKDERALLFYRGDFADVLRPGDHYRFDPLFRYKTETFSVADVRFENHIAEYIASAKCSTARRCSGSKRTYSPGRRISTKSPL